eukprot:5709040-Pyramimonas_sp.AAC.1
MTVAKGCAHLLGVRSALVFLSNRGSVVVLLAYGANLNSKWAPHCPSGRRLNSEPVVGQFLSFWQTVR